MKKLRLLVTAFDYRPRLGGIATLSYEVLAAMAKRGDVELRVIAPFSEGAESQQWDQRSSVSISRVRLPSTATRAIFPLMRAMISEKKTFQPDAILNLVWQPESVSTVLSQCTGKIPYFIYAHGVELMETRDTWRKGLRARFAPLKKAIFQGAAGCFANSHFTRDLLVRMTQVPSDRIEVAYPGVNPLQFYPAEQKSTELVSRWRLEGKTVFLTVTRLEDYKGVDRVLEAIALLGESSKKMVYLVCGEGPDLSRLQSLAQQLGVLDCVRFVGKIPADLLRDYYCVCDTFILLSRELPMVPQVEGFGLVFLEAAACERPSIGGLSGGVPEALGGTHLGCDQGWLVDPLHAPALAAVMKEVIENPDLALRKGKAARARVLSSLTWDHMAASLLQGIRAGLERSQN